MTNENKDAISVIVCSEFQFRFFMTVRFIFIGFEPQFVFITFGLLDGSLVVIVKIIPSVVWQQDGE